MAIADSRNFLAVESCLPLAPEEETEMITEVTRASETNQMERDLSCFDSTLMTITDSNSFFESESCLLLAPKEEKEEGDLSCFDSTLMTITDSNSFLAAESCLPFAPEEEKEMITQLTRASEADQKEGDLFYLVSSRWWRCWKEYVGLDRHTDLSTFSKHSNVGLLHISYRPGKIDNSELVLDGTNVESCELDLRRDLREEVDYHLVPQEVWNKLLEWYGGGPELPRKKISDCPFGKRFTVEVYSLRLKLIDARDNSEKAIRMSKKASVCELYNTVYTLLDLEQEKVHIWDYHLKRRRGLLSKFYQTLEEAHLRMDQWILLEVKVGGFGPSSFAMDYARNELAMVPVESSVSSISIAGGLDFSNGYSNRFEAYFLQGNSSSSAIRDTEDGNDIITNGTKEDGQGLAGLLNLGNTCFMNSTIQCLVHTPPLIGYFLQDYTEDINKQNPLGMEGELAIAFGELLRELWSSGCTSVEPRAFKAKLTRFAPQFNGYNQHDSQELLAFLLDGLHEDLNWVKSKPYIEATDANGRSDDEFADECWQNHKARNDSIIVDVCQGQYKSTLVCPVCNKVSVTFDPFMYLSLPIPSAVTRIMTVTVFSGEGSALPMHFTLAVPKNGCCKDLVQALNIACCLNCSEEALLLAEVHEDRIYRYLENPLQSLSTIEDNEYIVAYRLPINHEKMLRVLIMHRRSIRHRSEFQYSEYSVFQRFLGTPLVTCLAVDSQTITNIQAAVGTAMDSQTMRIFQAAVGTVLAPLLRRKVCSPGLRESSEDDRHELSSDTTTVPTENGSCSSESSSSSDMEVEDIAIGLPSFRFVFANDKPMSGSCITIMLDWSDRQYQLYDFSYLEDLPEVSEFSSMEKTTRQEEITLFSCLEAFLKEEPLGLEDMWYCPGCKEHRQATKKLDLWRLPKILVVHLKRFSYSGLLKDKLDTFVNYPLRDLELSKYVEHGSVNPQSHVYELYAVSNHYGGLDDGHYTAHAKLTDEDRWYHFDDGQVSPVSEDWIKTSAAYVLFYRRVEVDSRMDVEEASMCAE